MTAEVVEATLPVGAAEIVCEGASREEWLAHRRTGIGGSDIAGVLGISPFKSPMSVYVDKRGDVADDGETERMRWGSLLEAPMRQALSEEIDAQVLVPRPITMYRAKAGPCALYSPDAFAPREEALVELKTTDLRLSSRWLDDEGQPAVPVYYEAQVQWGLGILGLPRAFVYVLIGGNDPRLFTLEADPEVFADMLARAEEFWKANVVAGVMPETDGLAATTEALKRLLGRSEPASRIDVDDDFVELLQSFEAAKAFTKSARQREDAIANAIKARMAGVEEAWRGEELVCTFRSYDVKESYRPATTGRRLTPRLPK